MDRFDTARALVLAAGARLRPAAGGRRGLGENRASGSCNTL